MKTEWNFFKQVGKQPRIYQLLLLGLLMFFLLRYYKIFGSEYKIMPWVFDLELHQNFTQLILNNSMPIIYFIVGILLPINHFNDYLVNTRFLSVIRQQKSFKRYIYFLLFTFIYSVGYTVLVTVVVKLLGYHHTINGIFGQLIMLEILLMISMLFSLVNQKIIGDMISILIVITYVGVPMIAYFFETLIPGQIILVIFIIIIGIISNQLYLKHEIY